MTTIAQERARLAAVGMTLRRREQWGAKRSYTDARTVTEPATGVFVHITITNPSSYGSFDAHARAVENIGINRFPATGISYNRLIFAGTDTVYEGQPIGRRGAHTVNDFKRSTCSTTGCPGRGSSLTAPDWNLNYNARAYVICQNVQHVVTDQMVNAVAHAIAADALAGFITKAAAQNIHGHRCVSAKSCPGDRMWARMKDVQARVNQLIANGLQEEDMALSAEDKTWIANIIDAKIKALGQAETVQGLATNAGWLSPGAAAYARDTFGWKDANDPTKARAVALRYLTELALVKADQVLRKSTALEALVAQVAAGQVDDLTEDKIKQLLADAVIDVNVTVGTGTEGNQSNP